MKFLYVCGESDYIDMKMSNSGRALRGDNIKWGLLWGRVGREQLFSLRNEETMSWPDKLLVPCAVTFSNKYDACKINFNENNGNNKLQDVPV